VRSSVPAVLLSLLAVAACGDDDPTAGEARAGQVRDAAAAAGLPDDVADLLADAASAVDATFRVSYELVDRSVVVTQRPPDRRVEVTSGDGTVDATISVGGRTHACTDPPGEDGWRCEQLGEPPPDAGFEADAVADLADALAAGADRYVFVVEEREVAGTPARCLVTSLRPGVGADPTLGDEGVLCIAATGAVLLVERPAGTLRAASYATEVDDAAFELPTEA
jgi:hypothetical protein